MTKHSRKPCYYLELAVRCSAMTFFRLRLQKVVAIFGSLRDKLREKKKENVQVQHSALVWLQSTKRNEILNNNIEYKKQEASYQGHIARQNFTGEDIYYYLNFLSIEVADRNIIFRNGGPNKFEDDSNFL